MSENKYVFTNKKQLFTAYCVKKNRNKYTFVKTFIHLQVYEEVKSVYCVSLFFKLNAWITLVHEKLVSVTYSFYKAWVKHFGNIVKIPLNDKKRKVTQKDWKRTWKYLACYRSLVELSIAVEGEGIETPFNPSWWRGPRISSCWSTTAWRGCRGKEGSSQRTRPNPTEIGVLDNCYQLK